MLKDTINLKDNAWFKLNPNSNGDITEIILYEEEQVPHYYTGKQAKILLLLLNNYPNIISRDFIYEKVWLENKIELKNFQPKTPDEQNKTLNTKVKNTISKMIPFNESIMHDCLRSYGTAYSIILIESPFIDEDDKGNDNLHSPNVQWKEAWKLKKEGDKYYDELVQQMNLLSTKSAESRSLFDQKKVSELLAKAISNYEDFLSYSLLQNSNLAEVGMVYKKLATCYNYNKEHEKVIDYLTIAAKRYWDVTAMQNLAFIQKRRGNFPEAEKWYKIAAALGSKSAEFQFNKWMEERKNKE